MPKGVPKYRLTPELLAELQGVLRGMSKAERDLALAFLNAAPKKQKKATKKAAPKKQAPAPKAPAPKKKKKGDDLPPE